VGANLPAVELEVTVIEVAALEACERATVIGPDELPAVKVCAAVANDKDGDVTAQR
jgi:hypothetical protein